MSQQPRPEENDVEDDDEVCLLNSCVSHHIIDEYFSLQDPEETIGIKLLNIVATVNLGCRLDLVSRIGSYSDPSVVHSQVLLLLGRYYSNREKCRV